MTKIFSCTFSIVTAFVFFGMFMFALVQVVSEQKPRFAEYERPATFVSAQLDETNR